MSSFPSLVLRTGVVLLVALVLQSSVLSRHVIAGSSIDLFLVLSICAGLVGGAQRGAVTGFVSGVALDLLLVTPFGLSALTYAIVGYAVGLLGSSRVRQSRVFPVMVAAAAGAVGVVGFAVIGELVGQPYLSTPDLWRIVLVQSLGSALLALPVSAVLRWAWRPPVESRMVVVG